MIWMKKYREWLWNFQMILNWDGKQIQNQDASDIYTKIYIQTNSNLEDADEFCQCLETLKAWWSCVHANKMNWVVSVWNLEDWVDRTELQLWKESKQSWWLKNCDEWRSILTSCLFLSWFRKENNAEALKSENIIVTYEGRSQTWGTEIEQLESGNGSF